MNTEHMNINFADGQSVAQIEIREGKAPMQIEPKAPLEFSVKGVIGAPFEFLKKRMDKGQFEIRDCHIIVNREKVEITLVTNERDFYNKRTVTGQLQYHPAFAAFGINGDKVWTPTELGMFVKMNRAFFTDKSENMKLVSCLMNFTATINNKIERAASEKGDRTDSFAQVVNSNLPESFTLNIPIFKGMQPETLEVETFAQVNGREVSFVLLSPGAKDTLESLRDSVIESQLMAIAEIAPELAIIEV